MCEGDRQAVRRRREEEKRLTNINNCLLLGRSVECMDAPKTNTKYSVQVYTMQEEGEEEEEEEG